MPRKLVYLIGGGFALSLAATGWAQPVREHAVPFGWDEDVPRGVVTDNATGWGNGCWQGPAAGKSNYHVMFEDTAEGRAVTLVDLFGPGHGITVGDLAKLSFLTKKATGIPASHDWWITIYTQHEGDGGDSGSWYDSRLHARPDAGPGYSQSFTYDAWNLWSTTDTDSSTNQLVFYDSQRGYGGYYKSLGDVAAGPVDWDGDSIADHDYSAEEVRMITIQTDSGWNGFDGLIDGLVIELSGGSVGEIDLGGSVYHVEADTSYATIQGAIDDIGRSSGPTIIVGPGTYEEQVVIDVDDLTIIGAGSGDDPAFDTIILSPTTLTYFFNTGSVNYPVVGVDSVTGVAIENLRVDGAGRGNGNYKFEGVAFWNAGGTVEDCVVTGIRETPISGAQHGVGVYAYNDTGGPYTINVLGTEVDDYQKNGMALSGDGLTVNVNGCTVTGTGPLGSGLPAQNGIQVSYGAGGLINDCTVTDHLYTPATWAATGVLIYQASGITVSDSLLTDNQPSVYFQDSPTGTFSGLSISHQHVSSGDAFYVMNTTDTLLLSGLADTPLASPLEEFHQAPEARMAMTAQVSDSIIAGHDAIDSWGLGAISYGTDSVSLTIDDSAIRDWDYGVVGMESTYYIPNPGPVTVTAHNNSLFSNLSYGFYSDSSTAQDVSSNWWGSPGGPYDPTGTTPYDGITCPDVALIINNNPYGDGVTEANAEYCPWLAGAGEMVLEVDAACLSDTQIEVELWMRNVTGYVTGFQAFLVYDGDTTVLSYNDGLSYYNNAVFDQHFMGLGTGAQPGSGELMLDGNDSSSLGTDQDTLLAVLVFDVVGPCSTTEVEFDLTQPFDSELSFGGEPLASTLTDTIPFKLDSTPPVVTCGGNIEQSADAGDTSCQALVTWFAPTAVDACDGDVSGSLSYDIDLYSDMAVDATQATTVYTFPVGVHTVTATAMDGCGNAASCSFTVTVNNVYDILVDVQLFGNPNAVTRCIHFVLDDCTSVDASVSFVDYDSDPGTPVEAVAALIQVPCGTDWTMLCAKDEQHTKWDSTSLTDAGAVYTANTLLVIDGSDTDNDGDCDINDVTWYLAQVGSLANAGGCPWDGVTRDADFNNDGIVDSTGDYSFLSRNWLKTSSCACTLSLRGATITVQPRLVERSTAGLPAEVARRADLNRDGTINFEDVMLFEAEHGLPATLSTKMWNSTKEETRQN